MKKTITLLFLILITATGFAQEQIITICNEKNGCEYAKVNLTKQQLDNILSKPNFLAKEKEAVVLNLVACVSTIQKNKTPQSIHESFGGKGVIKERKNFDLRNYLLEKGCLSCPNTTKRIEFEASGDEFSGTGYYFHNIQAEESFIPNASWQELYAGEMEGLVHNTYLKKNQDISYFIDPEGKKWKIIMPYGSIFQDINETSFSANFHKIFKKTGNKKMFLNTNEFQYEYLGQDGEGKKMTLWLGPAGNVCFSKGKLIAAGFFNLGYIVIDGKSYLISELSGANFRVKVTGIQDGSYSFDTSGYKETPGF